MGSFTPSSEELWSIFCNLSNNYNNNNNNSDQIKIQIYCIGNEIEYNKFLLLSSLFFIMTEVTTF